MAVDATKLTEKITFQKQDTKTKDWTDIVTVSAYMAGLNNSEYWKNYLGGDADEVLTVSVRYKKVLAELIPQTSRIVHGGVVYDIISPPDDVLFKHVEIKFRVRRQIS